MQQPLEPEKKLTIDKILRIFEIFDVCLRISISAFEMMIGSLII